MKQALYFGCWDRAGHYLHDQHGNHLRERPDGCPWNMSLMDAGLLQNGKREDVVDGRVFWTCGGRSLDDLWLAFYWWDRSVDKRSNCNSGFYVHGFKHTEPDAAFDFACRAFTNVVARQAFPLVLQRKSPRPPIRDKTAPPSHPMAARSYRGAYRAHGIEKALDRFRLITYDYHIEQPHRL